MTNTMPRATALGITTSDLKAMKIEFGKDGAMKWQRVVPAVTWPAANAVIVADRHLPDGTRQHMIRGSAQPGLVIANAQVIGHDDVPQAEYSETLSHLSGSTDA